jgi:hypothetical protein
MNAETQRASDDLAFMRRLVESNGTIWRRQFGEAYFAAGLLYGAQLVFHWAQTTGAITSHAYDLVGGFGPTILYLAILAWILWRHRRTAASGGVTGRVVGAAFGAVGLANFALAAVIGSLALHNQSLDIWLLYPCSVFVFQGAAWLIAFAIQRRAWLAVVGLGWFAVAIAMALLIADKSAYMFFAAIGLFGLMALPGWAMIRMARPAT